MRLLIDMNLSPRLATHLSNHGHDATHWLEVGQPDAADNQILQWAGEQHRVIVTGDLDFGTMLIARNLDRPSIIQLRTEVTLAEKIGDLVATAIAQTETFLDDGAIVTIESTRVRVRRLQNEQ